MNNPRYSEGIDISHGLIKIEMLLHGTAQGLGIIDVELIEEFPTIDMTAKISGDEPRYKRLRHITLSELWIMGAYEFVRLLNEIILKDKSRFKSETIQA